MGPGAPAKTSWLAARWREASIPQRALVALLLPLFGAMWIIFTDAPPPAPAPETTASASASAAPSEVPSAASNEAPAAIVEEPANTATTDASAAPTAALPPGRKTPEREAADAVAAGDYARAATLYEALAKEHPDRKAYAEAARILRAKTKR